MSSFLPLIKLFALLTLTTAVTLGCSAQTRSQQTRTTPAFNGIRHNDIRHFAEIPRVELPADFTAAGYSYKVSLEGRITSSKPGTQPRSYRLRLPAIEVGVQPHYYLEYEGDVLLLCLVEYPDEDGEGAWLARLDPRAGRIIWEHNMPVLNVGQPLVEDGYAYVTGFESIGKINLSTGTYMWQHKPPEGFDFIAITEITDEVVRFQERDAYKQPGKRIITLDKRSGKPIVEGVRRERR